MEDRLFITVWRPPGLAFFWCWWSWIIAIIQGKKRKKEEGKRKGRGEKIERDALRASRVTCGCGTCAPVTRAQRTGDATVTLPRRTEASWKKKNLTKWQNKVEVCVMKEEHRGRRRSKSSREENTFRFFSSGFDVWMNTQHSITDNDSNVRSRVT